jgi:hypothetical protein
MNSYYDFRSTWDDGSPFGEPRTIPGAWDVSSFFSPTPGRSNAHHESEGFAEGEAGSEEEGEAWRLESFQEVRTTPKYWNLSEIAD